MVYFITDGTYTKIGKADDPKKRLRELQTGNSRKLNILIEIIGGVDLEGYFHKRFRDKRSIGEWFSLTEEDIEDVKMEKLNGNKFKKIIEEKRNPHNKLKKRKLVNKDSSIIAVRKAIDIIKNRGSSFITAKLLAKETGLHINTVQSIFRVEDFKVDIDEYNYKKFKTIVYSTHKKNINVDRIVQAIDDYVVNNEDSLTKRGVARKSGLHYQTVGNLWGDKAVISAYDRYNIWIYELKQIA